MIGFLIFNMNDLKNSMALIKSLPPDRVVLIMNCIKIRDHWPVMNDVGGIDDLGCRVIRLTNRRGLDGLKLSCCFMNASYSYILSRDLKLFPNSLGDMYGLGWGWDTFKSAAMSRQNMFKKVILESEHFVKLRGEKHNKNYMYGHPYYDFSHLQDDPYEKYGLPRGRKIALVLHTFSMRLEPAAIVPSVNEICDILHKYGFYVVFKHKNNMRSFSADSADLEIREDGVGNVFSTVEIGKVCDAFVVPGVSRVFVEGVLSGAPIIMGDYSDKKSTAQKKLFNQFCKGITVSRMVDAGNLLRDSEQYKTWLNKWIVQHPEGNAKFVLSSIGLV